MKYTSSGFLLAVNFKSDTKTRSAVLKISAEFLKEASNAFQQCSLNFYSPLQFLRFQYYSNSLHVNIQSDWSVSFVTERYFLAIFVLFAQIEHILFSFKLEFIKKSNISIETKLTTL